MRVLGMPAPWHAVRIGGWKFLMADSMGGARRYSFGAEQLAWIERELAGLGAGEHAALCCHVPIQSPGAWMWMVNRSAPEKWGFPYGDLQRDLKEVTDLLRRFPRAKAVLSGHIHYVDAVEYLGVTHLNSGAVSGNWWKGDGVLDRDFPPAFAIVDLHPDGRVERRMVSYAL
jgi:3',5'-cyclic AMP phosphodiesterase CpdA